MFQRILSSDDGQYWAKHVKILFMLKTVALDRTYSLFHRIIEVTKLIGYLT
jgi:hypothetical protein